MLNNANRESLTVGGRVFTDLANLIVIRNYATGATYSAMKSNATGTPTAYTPSGAKKLRVLAIEAVTIEAGNSIRSMGSADNAVADNAAGAPTNPVPWRLGVVSNASANAQMGTNAQQYACNEVIPNGKYGYCQGIAMTMYGYEE